MPSTVYYKADKNLLILVLLCNLYMIVSNFAKLILQCFAKISKMYCSKIKKSFKPKTLLCLPQIIAKPIRQIDTDFGFVPTISHNLGDDRHPFAHGSLAID